MKNIYDISFEKLETYFTDIGQKKFKAVQVYDWLYKKRVTSFEEMTNIKKEIINHLKQNFSIQIPKIIKKEEDVDVIKFLFELSDYQKVEAVLMKHDYGNSLCVSTQVGCNMGCSFCESGRLKKIRNLEVHEMVGQILAIERIIKVRISHVVLMGIGEPFDNYDHIIDFIHIINSGKGIAIGSRHITVSTCGIIPKIKRFIEDGKQVNLAISLHAPNNLMPINKVYPIEPLMEVLKEYTEKTGRRLTFEYILLDGINDQVQHALELAKLVQNMNCYINLIPYNETSHLQYKKSNQTSIMHFYDILKQNHVAVTIRREFGSKVSAACGQLRANYEEGK